MNGTQIMSGDTDICSEGPKNKEAIAKLEMMGFPTECPVPEVKICIF